MSMVQEIKAKHIGSFYERDGPLDFNQLIAKLKEVSASQQASYVPSRLLILDNKVLTVHVNNQPKPSEVFKLALVENVNGYTATKHSAKFRHLLTFRYKLSKVNGSRNYDEVHTFLLNTELELTTAVSMLKKAINSAKTTDCDFPPKLPLFDGRRYASPKRPSMERMRRRNSAEVARLQTTPALSAQRRVSPELPSREFSLDAVRAQNRLPRTSRPRSEIFREDLKSVQASLNIIVEEIKQFEMQLRAAITASKDSKHRGNVMPPPTSAVVNHVKNIRKGMNLMSELHNELPDPKIVNLGNCFLESMSWLMGVAVSRQFPHIHDRLIKSVWLPTFTNQSVQFLQNYLDEKNKTFLKSLGPAWNQEGFQADTPSLDPRQLSAFSYKGSDDGEDEDEGEVIPKTPTTRMEPVKLPSIAIHDTQFTYQNRTNSRNRINDTASLVSRVSGQGSTATVVPTRPNGTCAFQRTFANQNFLNAVRHRHKTAAVVIRKFVGQSAMELSVDVGDLVEVLDLDDTWCCVRTVNATTGHVPAESIRVLTDNDDREGSLVSYHSTKSCQTDQMQATSRSGTACSTRPLSIAGRSPLRADNQNGNRAGPFDDSDTIISTTIVAKPSQMNASLASQFQQAFRPLGSEKV